MTLNKFTVGSEHTIDYYNVGDTKVTIVDTLDDILFYENKEKNVDNSCHYEEFEAMLVR